MLHHCCYGSRPSIFVSLFKEEQDGLASDEIRHLVLYAEHWW